VPGLVAPHDRGWVPGRGHTIDGRLGGTVRHLEVGHLPGAGDRRGDPVAGALVDDRPDRDVRIARVAPFQCGGPGAQPVEQLIGARVVHDDAAVRGASLAGEGERTIGQLGGGEVDVGVGPDQRGIVAAQLGLQRDPAARADLLGAVAGPGGAGEGDRVHGGIGHRGLPGGFRHRRRARARPPRNPAEASSEVIRSAIAFAAGAGFHTTAFP